MSIPIALVLAALILALIEEAQSRGRSLLGWAVVLIAVAAMCGQWPL